MQSHQQTRVSDNCPVRPLGTCQDWYFFIDALGQYRALRATQLSRGTVFGLFGGIPDYLQAHWPAGSDATWDHVKASEALIAAAIHAGIVDDPRSLGFSLSNGVEAAGEGSRDA